MNQTRLVTQKRTVSVLTSSILGGGGGLLSTGIYDRNMKTALLALGIIFAGLKINDWQKGKNTNDLQEREVSALSSIILGTGGSLLSRAANSNKLTPAVFGYISSGYRHLESYR